MAHIVGIIGGGQLGVFFNCCCYISFYIGRLLIEYGLNRISCEKIRVLNPTPECSVSAANFENVECVVGSYQNEADLRSFVKDCTIGS